MKIILSFLYISGILALGRLIPHPPNFTPILAAAIFAPYIIRDRWTAMAVPLMAMFIGDVFIGFHPYMLWVYGAIAMSTVISKWSMQFGKYLPLATMTLVSSVLFYIVTNFAVWIVGLLFNIRRVNDVLYNGNTIFPKYSFKHNCLYCLNGIIDCSIVSTFT